MNKNFRYRFWRNSKASPKSHHDFLIWIMVFGVATLLLSISLAAVAAQNAASAQKGSAGNGKLLFASAGCATCHGDSAKGLSGLGPQISPPAFAIPDFINFVREPADAMPPFSKQLVSDTQLSDIFAYLQSLSPDSNIPEANTTGNAETGKRLYMRDGCYECHGNLGQGANGCGPRIAPNPISIQAITNYIRKPAGNMPPYTAKIVSDQDVADIYAYLKSVARPVDIKNIPFFTR
jgi:mono/diheme cytochrome c family protein